MIPRQLRVDHPPIPISLPKVLLVEGQTPMHFLEAFLRNLGSSEHVEVRDFGGVKDLRKSLRALTASSEFQERVKSLGIIRDAETDAKAARQSVDHALKQADLQQEVRTSVFILPDNKSPGMLETLCLDSVQEQSIYECVTQFFECAARHEAKLPPHPKVAKSYAQAFLALQENVEPYPGRAAYQDVWPWESPVFSDLKKFLSEL